ncbi:dTDP-4-dehydrorhamnose 3,5-epimerase family protein [Dongia deserti]|uniref:dTDP-4-dehydrorhamnose 3,5-epimerase family protein n=1 Tax=Dongia deserti TaxID=2268030 RepID=UPI000E656C67|nr:dTDP-4-dehydrorhamnose 3,5-epimerase family protein [Dongia deserti]
MILPADVRLMPLQTHPDARGELTEIFRKEWHGSPSPVQWTACQSAPNALRGIHVYRYRWNYLCVIAGEMFVGLHDLRPEEPTARRSAMLRLNGRQLQMLVIPPGVAHGFYSSADSMFFTGASVYDDHSDHQRCRWDAPELGLEWPCTAPELSASDRDAGDYADLAAAPWHKAAANI